MRKTDKVEASFHGSARSQWGEFPTKTTKHSICLVVEVWNTLTEEFWKNQGKVIIEH